MSNYSLTHLGDGQLVRDLTALVARDRATTAALLAHLAEFDSRRLYLPAAHPSTYSYCVHELHLSEDVACKRIQAARAARRFPVLFEAVADGRLHVSAVVLLAPYLTPENIGELLAAASHRTKARIEELLAARFPRTEALALEQVIPAPPRPEGGLSAPGRMKNQHVTGTVGTSGPDIPEAPACQAVPREVGSELSPGTVATFGPERSAAASGPSAAGPVEHRPKLTPVAAERYLLQVTIGRGTQDKLQHARNLLGHQIPSGDLSQVLDRALDALIEKLERRKLAATSRPRRPGRPSADPRHVPAHVKRAVWERDRGQCTFTSPTGHRCSARTRLEFDHVTEVARGGGATVAGIRLRCRAHNQYTAERTFGTEFMREKRDAARHATAAPLTMTKAADDVQQRVAQARATMPGPRG